MNWVAVPYLIVHLPDSTRIITLVPLVRKLEAELTAFLRTLQSDLLFVNLKFVVVKRHKIFLNSFFLPPLSQELLMHLVEF